MSDDNDKVALHTYLRDHTTGAQHALALFKALGEVHAGTLLGRFASDQFHEVETDLIVLERLATDIGADGFQLKEAVGWLGDKLTRLKVAPLAKPLHTFEALEFLSLGILGKRALWRALSLIGLQHPELKGVQFASLIERAEQQYAKTEEMRLRLASKAFGVEGSE